MSSLHGPSHGSKLSKGLPFLASSKVSSYASNLSASRNYEVCERERESHLVTSKERRTNTFFDQSKQNADKSDIWDSNSLRAQENTSSSRLPPSQQDFKRKGNGLSHLSKYDKYESQGALTSEDSTDDIFPTR